MRSPQRLYQARPNPLAIEIFIGPFLELVLHKHNQWKRAGLLPKTVGALVRDQGILIAIFCPFLKEDHYV